MAWASPHSVETRAAVEAMLRDTDLPMIEIGRRLGVSPGTVSTWNGRGRWRRPRRVGRPGLSPAEWPPLRLQALARLYYAPANDPGDIALAMGLGRASARALFLAAGFTRRRDRAAPAHAPSLAPAGGVPGPGAAGSGVARSGGPGPGVPALADLNAAIRVQIGRQIEAFAAALDGQAAAVIDSARVLRDLGGLKRLLDDLNADPNRARDVGPSAWQGADDGGPETLAALRDAVSRRFAALPGPDGPPGDPGGAA